MHFVADLHLHSKYSRAVSAQMTLPVMAQKAAQKGINILTASDWTHPMWLKEINAQLTEAGNGIYALKEQKLTINNKEIYFLLSTEISSIYKQGDKLRRIHNLIFVPDITVAEKVNKELARRGCNLTADGRPIIGLSSKNLLELLLSIDDHAFLIPCHIWTPHFGMYGSASGYDSLEEAFDELAPYIYGIETGLSSDPDMNWQVGELLHRSILSFSDAHSPAKMGREATVFELSEVSYENIRSAIRQLSVLSSQLSESGLSVSQSTRLPKTERQHTENRQQITDNRIAYTLEFYPEEGKYHFSGHRNCKVVVGPEEVKNGSTLCPVCHRRLTEGVLFRVQQLSDNKLLGRAERKTSTHSVQWFTDKFHLQPPYVKLVPLLEIVAEGLGSTVSSQKSNGLFEKLCRELESEIHVLLKAPLEDIEKCAGWKIAEGVRKVRAGEIAIDPGYDGEYGKVAIWNEEETTGAGEIKEREGQMRLDL